MEFVTIDQLEDQKWLDVKSEIFGRLKISNLNDRIFHFTRIHQGAAIYMLKRENIIFQITIVTGDQLLRDETAEYLLEKEDIVMFTFCSFHDSILPVPAGIPIIYQRSNRHILN